MKTRKIVADFTKFSYHTIIYILNYYPLQIGYNEYSELEYILFGIVKIGHHRHILQFFKSIIINSTSGNMCSFMNKLYLINKRLYFNPKLMIYIKINIPLNFDTLIDIKWNKLQYIILNDSRNNFFQNQKIDHNLYPSIKFLKIYDERYTGNHIHILDIYPRKLILYLNEHRYLTLLSKYFGNDKSYNISTLHISSPIENINIDNWKYLINLCNLYIDINIDDTLFKICEFKYLTTLRFGSYVTRITGFDWIGCKNIIKFNNPHSNNFHNINRFTKLKHLTYDNFYIDSSINYQSLKKLKYLTYVSIHRQCNINQFVNVEELHIQQINNMWPSIFNNLTHLNLGVKSKNFLILNTLYSYPYITIFEDSYRFPVLTHLKLSYMNISDINPLISSKLKYLYIFQLNGNIIRREYFKLQTLIIINCQNINMSYVNNYPNVEKLTIKNI